MIWGAFRKFVLVWFCGTVAGNAVLLDMLWRINNHGGVYKKGAVFPLQKQYQIAASYVRTGSCGAAAAENMCTYNAARKIIDKFMTTGLFEPGGRGSPQTIMQPWKVAYLEALVTYNSFMYLSEIQKALRDKPTLTCSWNSIYPYKLQNSYQFRLNETQGSKGTFGKVYTSEHSSMNSVCAMGKNCWPKKALFCWRDYYSTC